MHEHHDKPKPIGKGAHFGLSFLAVLLGVPISIGIIAFFGFFVILIIGIIISASFAGSANDYGSPTYEAIYGTDGSRNRLVSLSIHGPIMSQSSASDPLQIIFGGGVTDGEKIKERLQELADDNSVQGIILEIDSPGGLITASKAIADGAEYVQARGKPIIAHINGLGASGGYWVAASTDYILAEQGSEAGSIGVILGSIPYYKDIIATGEVATKEPIVIRNFSAGESKDIGNPYRDMTQAEIDYLNKSLQDEYKRFVDYVAGRRGVSAEHLTSVVKALPYGTTAAKDLKLIDGEASREEAYRELANRAGISNNFVVERELREVDFLSSLLGVIGQSDQKSVNTDARARHCATLQTKPLVLGVSLQSICQ